MIKIKKGLTIKEREMIAFLWYLLGVIYISGVIFLTEPGTLNYLWFLS